MLLSTAFFSFAHSLDASSRFAHSLDASSRTEARRMFPITTKADGVRSRGANCKCRAPEPRWILMESQIPLVGDEDNSGFGSSVAISGDGKTFAVGAPNKSGGQVRLFRYNDVSFKWEMLDTIDGVFSENSAGGTSISLSKDGNILALGAPNDEGEVHFYKYDVDSYTWVKMGNPNTVVSADRYYYTGESISLSDDGETVAIGSNSGNRDDGETLIYKFNENTNTWEQSGEIIGLEKDGTFGDSVSLSQDGGYVAIAATERKYDGKGVVRIYKYNSSEEKWEEVGAFHGSEAEDNFGNSISLKTDKATGATIVAMGASPPSTRGGYVTVHSFDGDSWTKLGHNIPVATYTENVKYSTTFVDLSDDGNVIAVGSHQDDTRTGLVRVYKYDSLKDEWKQVGDDISNDDGKQGDRFGSSVSLSDDGETVVIGAGHAELDFPTFNNYGRGYVQVYKLGN